jgi:hypothetical protein
MRKVFEFDGSSAALSLAACSCLETTASAEVSRLLHSQPLPWFKLSGELSLLSNRKVTQLRR